MNACASCRERRRGGAKSDEGALPACTDKKENKIFLIYKEIQKGAVAKSYMTRTASYMTKYLPISSYMRKPFLIIDFASAPV
jgi:hypothetical protein